MRRLRPNRVSNVPLACIHVVLPKPDQRAGTCCTVQQGTCWTVAEGPRGCDVHVSLMPAIPATWSAMHGAFLSCVFGSVAVASLGWPCTARSRSEASVTTTAPSRRPTPAAAAHDCLSCGHCAGYWGNTVNTNRCLCQAWPGTAKHTADRRLKLVVHRCDYSSRHALHFRAARCKCETQGRRAVTVPPHSSTRRSLYRKGNVSALSVACIVTSSLRHGSVRRARLLKEEHLDHCCCLRIALPDRFNTHHLFALQT
jgi:hypothetical protein